VQRNAMRAFQEQRDFKSLLLADVDLMRVLSSDDVHRAFDLTEQLRNVDAIFARVFNQGIGAAASIVAGAPRAEVHR
jgi:adenylosuccinate lyase